MSAGDSIIAVFLEGVDASRRGVGSPAVSDACQDLKRLIAGALPRRQRGLIDAAEIDPQAWAGPLAEAIRQQRADLRKDVQAAVWRLKNLLHPSHTGQTAGGTGPVNAVDNGPAPVRPQVATRSGRPRSPFSGLDKEGRIVGKGTELAGPYASLQFFLGSQIMSSGADKHARLLRDYPRHAYGLVTLIEECSGIQIGDRNEQFSVYQVTVPTAALSAASELAEVLLAPGTPWSRDVFAHDAELAPLASPQDPDRDSRAIVPGPGGNVLVIVRNSRGVQVGDRNVQHNLFRIRVAAVSVWPEEMELTRARRDAVARLHKDPKDRGAARLLAADIADAASASLQADLRARVSEQAGDPHIPDPTSKLRNLVGRQVGKRGRAQVKVEIEDMATFDANALTEELTKAALYVKTLEDALAQTAEVTAAEPPSAAVSPDPRRLPPPSKL